MLKQLLKTTANESITGSYYNLFCVTRDLGLNMEDIFKLYVGKSVLNEFRQNNGYKEGTYIKIWDGNEDNEVLTSILDHTETITSLDRLKTNIYMVLAQEYPG